MLDDWKAIEKIRADSIDILVDLAGHTAGNRLPLFMARPAPVQISWLGYPATTGVAEIGYRVTDIVADPQGAENYYSERLLRLPDCFLCYEPPEKCPPITLPPALVNGYVTFGSFNNIAKMNHDVIRLWSDLLLALPDSRIMIKNPSLGDLPTAKRYMDRFAHHGIDPGRILLRGFSQTTEEHLEAYSQIDVALDTFPYNGTTTTCEALYMGVPVVSLCGEMHAGRVGASILSVIGQMEMVATSRDGYLSTALRLAENPDELSRLRESLRDCMCSSPLCNGKLFARKMEQTYRSAWHNWCTSQAPDQV
jgi:predicted O-linked N-acetylglucosamine transferase (SPINDLY family)